MVAGTELKISLPEYQDLDGDNVEITKINYGAASTFITGEYPNLVVKPGAVNYGDFTITITLTDDNTQQKSTTVSFKITVSKSLIDDPTKNGTNSTSSNSSSQPDKSVTNNTNKDFKAQIRTITMTGEVFVSFSSGINIP